MLTKIIFWVWVWVWGRGVLPGQQGQSRPSLRRRIPEGLRAREDSPEGGRKEGAGGQPVPQDHHGQVEGDDQEVKNRKELRLLRADVRTLQKDGRR